MSFSFAADVGVGVSRVKTPLKIDGSTQVGDCDYTAQPLGGNVCNRTNVDQGVAETEHACSANSPRVNTA